MLPSPALICCATYVQLISLEQLLHFYLFYTYQIDIMVNRILHLEKFTEHTHIELSVKCVCSMHAAFRQAEFLKLCM